MFNQVALCVRSPAHVIATSDESEPAWTNAGSLKAFKGQFKKSPEGLFTFPRNG
jgi:hypothetical protein